MSVDRRYALLRHDHGLGDPVPFSLSSVADNEFLQYNSTSGKWENFDLYAADNAWTGSNTYSERIQVTGSTAPASGSGIELAFSSDQGYVQAYNRTGSAYKNLILDGLSVVVAVSGTTLATFSSNTLTLSGAAGAAMNFNIDGASGQAPYCVFRENATNKAFMWYDATNHYFVIRKALDSNASTAVNQIVMYDAGYVSIADVTNSTTLIIGNTPKDLLFNGYSVESYGIRLSAAGTRVAGPSGWTYSAPATGQYRVTHNLGKAFSAVAVPEGSSSGVTRITVNYLSLNALDFYLRNSTGTSTNGAMSAVIQVAK